MNSAQLINQDSGNYYLPDGTKKRGVTKGSVVTYLGDNVEKFTEVFTTIGTVK